MTQNFKLSDLSGLSVAPFLLVPIAKTNQEADFLFGPKQLTKKRNEILHILDEGSQHDHSNLMLIAKSITRTELLVCKLLKSRIRDTRSGRTGLKLAYGLLVDPRAYIANPDVVRSGFDLLDQFLESAFQTTADVEGLEKIVKHYQQINIINIGLDSSRQAELYRIFQNRFGSRSSNNGILVNFLAQTRSRQPLYVEGLYGQNQSYRSMAKLDDRYHLPRVLMKRSANVMDKSTNKYSSTLYRFEQSRLMEVVTNSIWLVSTVLLLLPLAIFVLQALLLSYLTAGNLMSLAQLILVTVFEVLACIFLIIKLRFDIRILEQISNFTDFRTPLMAYVPIRLCMQCGRVSLFCSQLFIVVLIGSVIWQIWEFLPLN